MTNGELVDWMALYKREPWGREAEAGQLAEGFAVVANLLVQIARANGVKFIGRPKFLTKDFLYGNANKGPKVAISKDELRTKLVMWATAHNARLAKKEKASADAAKGRTVAA